MLRPRSPGPGRAMIVHGMTFPNPNYKGERPMPPHLGDLLSAAVAHLSPEFRAESAALWQPEHLERLADRLTALRRGVVDRPPPTFAEETTPSLGPVFAPWLPVLADLDTSADPPPAD